MADGLKLISLPEKILAAKRRRGHGISSLRAYIPIYAHMAFAMVDSPAQGRRDAGRRFGTRGGFRPHRRLSAAAAAEHKAASRVYYFAIARWGEDDHGHYRGAARDIARRRRKLHARLMQWPRRHFPPLVGAARLSRHDAGRREREDEISRKMPRRRATMGTAR